MKFLMMFLLSAAIPVNSYSARFIDCYDGDTCTFDIIVGDMTMQAGLDIKQRTVLTRTSQKIRLCDINAPEMKPGPNAAAIKARDDLVSWITNANQLVIQVPQKSTCWTGEHDETSCDQYEKYGRLLGYIFADGIDLNKKQLDSDNAVRFMSCTD